MRLEDLRQVFGGRIRELCDCRWLDARVGGLRAFIICRATTDGGVTFDLAVFTPNTRELDPFFARDKGQEWCLDQERELPRLRPGFLFAGCRRGILFASSTSEPSLDTMVSTLWDLAEWARKPWHYAVVSSESAKFRAGERARIRRARLTRVGWVLLVVAVVLWLRGDAARLLFALVTALARYSPTADDAVGYDT